MERNPLRRAVGMLDPTCVQGKLKEADICKNSIEFDTMFALVQTCVS